MRIKGIFQDTSFDTVISAVTVSEGRKNMNRTIRVTGKAKLFVRPDTVRLGISAEGVFPEYSTTVEKSAEHTALLQDALEKAGFDPKELKTVSFEIDSKYENYRDKRDNWRKKFVGYQYNHSMHIDFPNDNVLLGKAFRALAECPVKVEFSVNYTIKDPNAVKNDLLKKAVGDSRVKAAVLTEAAGVELGDVLSIDYSWGEVEIRSNTRYVDRYICADTTAMKEDDGYSLDLEADDIRVEDMVTVIWEVR